MERAALPDGLLEEEAPVGLEPRPLEPVSTTEKVKGHVSRRGTNSFWYFLSTVLRHCQTGLLVLVTMETSVMI